MDARFKAIVLARPSLCGAGRPCHVGRRNLDQDRKGIAVFGVGHDGGQRPRLRDWLAGFDQAFDVKTESLRRHDTNVLQRAGRGDAAGEQRIDVVVRTMDAAVHPIDAIAHEQGVRL